MTASRLLLVYVDKPNPPLIYSGERHAYAHPRILGAAMREDASQLSTLDDVDLSPSDFMHPMPMQDFEAKAQLDNRQSGADPYDIRYGYVVCGGIIDARNVRRLSRPLAAIETGLARIERQHGSTSSFGVMAVRLAMVMKADRIVLMPPHPWSNSTTLGSRFSRNDFGAAVSRIDSLVQQAWRQCRESCGESVA
jgi:hypothetical protein